MFITPKNIAALTAFACAPLVSAQESQTAPAAGNPAPAAPASAPRPRRAGFLSGVAAEKETQRPESLRFTVEQAVAKALEGNRELRAASYLVEEARGRRDGAGLLSNPELDLAAGPGTYGVRDAMMFQGAIMQKFPITSRLRLEEQIADTEIAAAREEVLIARRKLIATVKSDAVRLIALRDENTLLRRQKELSDKFAEDTRARAARGEGDTLQSGFLALESADTADIVARVEADRAALLAKFRTDLGLRPDADADIAGDLPDSRDAYGTPDPAACPECRKMTLLADASQKNVELEQAKKWQDVGVGIFGQVEHTSDTNNNVKRHETLGYVGLKVSVPLPLWNDNSGAVRGARARRERLKEELAGEILRLDGEAQSARRELDKLTARLPELRDKLLPAARDLAKRTGDAVTKGEGAPSDLYRAMDKLTALERRETALRRDIALAFVRLEFALSAHPAMLEPLNEPKVSE